MASGFFALLDDISTLMDDIATTTKIATQKTVGILGDDLAVNAKQASGFVSSREIPVLIAITKGSIINKLILLPIVFVLSAFFSWAITPILLMGGVYLSYEGAEKIYEYLFFKKHKESSSKKMDEKTKIKSAIRTDFILSIEIVIIAIGNVQNHPIYVQIPVVTIVALLATIGVYGIVALIVRMDDIGIKLVQLSNGKNRVLEKIGILLIESMPFVIRLLSVVGTAAMIIVAGGIYLHNIHTLHKTFEGVPYLVGELLIGLCIGFFSLSVVRLIKKAKN